MTNNDDFTTTNGQYVPSDEDAADNYVFGRGSEDPGLSLPELRAEYGPEFDRFLARVRREALGGLAEARIKAVRDIHTPKEYSSWDGDGAICQECLHSNGSSVEYPCPTIRALDGPDQEATIRRALDDEQ